MPMSLLECSTIPLEPTNEELDKIAELQLLLKEYLMTTKMNDDVRQALASYHNDEQCLIKYVRGRKLNVTKALTSLISFAEVKHVKYPDIFETKVPDYVPYAFQCGVITVLKQRDSLRRTIILCSASLWDESRIALEDFPHVGRYLVDVLMCDPGFLKYGAVLVIDGKGVTFSHLRQFSNLTVIVKLVNLFWQAYPIPIKGVYIVNAPFISKPFFAVLKPFLPAKLKDRLLFVSGVSELHKRISTDILPERVGGKVLDDEVQSQPILNYFTQLSQ